MTVRLSHGRSGARRGLPPPLAVASKADGAALARDDYYQTIKYTGAGRYIEREYAFEERPLDAIAARLGEVTGDLYWSGSAFWKNVLREVYAYSLGGYPVLKMWLSYRHKDILGRALRADEILYLQDVARRIAEVLLLAPKLDDNYRRIKEAVRGDC